MPRVELVHHGVEAILPWCLWREGGWVGRYGPGTVATALPSGSLLRKHAAAPVENRSWKVAIKSHN